MPELLYYGLVQSTLYYYLNIAETVSITDISSWNFWISGWAFNHQMIYCFFSVFAVKTVNWILFERHAFMAMTYLYTFQNRPYFPIQMEMRYSIWRIQSTKFSSFSIEFEKQFNKKAWKFKSRNFHFWKIRIYQKWIWRTIKCMY